VSVVVGLYNNNNTADIGSGAFVSSAQQLTVNAQTNIPYEIRWLELNGLGDIIDKLNSNFGIQSGFFTSWSQANAQGNTTAVAGTVDIFQVTTTTNSTTDAGAQVNQDNTFNPATAIPGPNDSITFASPENFQTGDAVVYHTGGGTAIGLAGGRNLTEGGTYYV